MMAPATLLAAEVPAPDYELSKLKCPNCLARLLFEHGSECPPAT